MGMRTVSRIVCSTFILLIAVAAPGIVYADSLAAVKLLVGRSMVIDVGTPISRVSLTSADVADAMVTSGNQLLVNGKTPGTITMFVWERAGALRQYEIVVQRDLAILNDQLRKLFPGESIDAQSNGKAIVLSGLVSGKDVADKAINVAAGYVEKAGDIVNLLQTQQSTGSNQVLLRVRFAEVSRSAVTDLGASFFTGANGYKDVLARSTTSTAAPVFDNSNAGTEKLVFSDFLNLFLFDAKHQLGTVIKALQTKGQFQILAEPNLVAESGKEASFLAGGEFPVPIAQGSGNNAAISIQYKEFGVRLNFTPVINGDRVHLKVRPEVSTLDFANGVTLQGFRVPALSTRRTETELELQDGQTFAIAGLLNNSVNSTLQKIPGIGDIPILGLLFKSKAASKEQSELVVMITPQILTRNSSGVTTTLPKTPEPFLAPIPPHKLIDPLPPAFTPERSNVPTSAPAPKTKPVATAAPASTPNAGEAAATVSAIMRPKPLPVVVQGPPPPPSPVSEPGKRQPQPATPPQVQAQGSQKATAQAQSQALPAKQTAGSAAMPKLTRDERKALERAQKEEKKEQERLAKVAREQAKLAREQAKKNAQTQR